MNFRSANAPRALTWVKEIRNDNGHKSRRRNKRRSTLYHYAARQWFDTRPFPGVHAVPDIMMLALIVLAVLVPAVYAGLCRFI
jgi:hypothetical protein